MASMKTIDQVEDEWAKEIVSFLRLKKYGIMGMYLTDGYFFYDNQVHTGTKLFPSTIQQQISLLAESKMTGDNVSFDRWYKNQHVSNAVILELVRGGNLIKAQHIAEIRDMETKRQGEVSRYLYDMYCIDSSESFKTDPRQTLEIATDMEIVHKLKHYYCGRLDTKDYYGTDKVYHHFKICEHDQDRSWSCLLPPEQLAQPQDFTVTGMTYLLDLEYGKYSYPGGLPIEYAEEYLAAKSLKEDVSRLRREWADG